MDTGTSAVNSTSNRISKRVEKLAYPAYISEEKAKLIAEENYGIIICKILSLNGFDSRNFKITTEDNREYVYKILCLTASTHEGLLEAQVKLMGDIVQKRPGITQEVIPNKFGKKITTILLPNDKHPQEGSYHKSVLLTYLPGPLLGDFAFHFTDEVIYDTGVFMAKLDTFLMNYRDEVYEKIDDFPWDVKNVIFLQDLPLQNFIKNVNQLQLLKYFFSRYQPIWTELLPNCRKSIIHGDGNNDNLLISEDKSKISAILDFDDVVYSHLVFELGNLIMYNTKGSHVDDMTRITSQTIKGYESILPLIPAEKDFLYYAVSARFCQDLVLGLQSYMNAKQPDDYLIRGNENGWLIFEELLKMSCEEWKKAVHFS